MKSFGSLLRTAFKAVHGWLLGGIGIVLSVGALGFGAATTVPLWLFATAVVAMALATVTLYEASRLAWAMASKSLPTVQQVMVAPPSYHGIELLLLLEPSEMFVAGMVVSIYLNEDSYERFVGVGQVMTVQENRCIQIGLMRSEGLDADLIGNLSRGEATFIKRLVVRPNVPSFVLQG